MTVTERIPSPGGDLALSRLLVLMDYDGTITTRECNEVILQRFVGDAWRPLEEASRRGELGHAECFRRQVALIDVSRDELVAAAVEAAVPAPGFAAFLEQLVAGGARVVVVSAGFREAITAVWRREDLAPVALYATELRSGPGGAPPHEVVFDPRLGDCPRCGPSSCKAGVLRDLRRTGDAVAVFGDGVSDLCLARAAGLVFARGSLARLLGDEGLPFVPLHDFTTVMPVVREWLATVARR